MCINISECFPLSWSSMGRSGMRSMVGTSEGAGRLSHMQVCRFDTSSIIDRAGYDDETRLLCLRFLDTGCYFYFEVQRILFDARPPKDATRPGGHGRAFDWTLLARLPRNKPVMLSGGLNPENVASAIRTAHPDAVDVSSGVEQSPGVKDPVKIAAFVSNAREAASLVPEKAS